MYMSRCLHLSVHSEDVCNYLKRYHALITQTNMKDDIIRLFQTVMCQRRTED